MTSEDYKKSFENTYNKFKNKKPYYKLMVKKLKSKEMLELIYKIEEINKDFNNFVKHSEKQKGEIQKIAEEEVIKDMLPVLDSFEKAFKCKENNFEEFKEGSKLIKKQLSEVIGG